MKIIPNRSARALVALVPTLMLVSPAFAQEAPTQTVPPPAPVEQAAPAAPAPATPVFAPSAPVVQAVPDYTRASPSADAPTAAEEPAARTAVAPVRRAPVAQSARSAPTPRAVAAAPAARPAATAPVQSAPTTPVVTPTPLARAAATETAAPVAPTTEAAPAATTTQTTQSTFALWPWIVGAGIVVLGLIALLASRRRRRVDTFAYDEPVYEEPIRAEAEPIAVPVAAPAVAPARDPEFLRPAPLATEQAAAPAPMPAEETVIADADQSDVDALTGGDAPVANRPWLEFGMRPIRAGTTSDEALVEIELTVGNAGSVAADDVRISTFLFASEPADADEFEKLLLEHGADATADPVTIAAGEGTRVDATLALPKHDLAALFTPVVVADARYRLPDGTEGRTFASFSIGMTQENGTLGAMENNRPSMHEDIEARLYGSPQHA